MKYYFVGYYCHVSESMTLYDEFFSESDAINNLEKYALKHIKKAQGKKQVEICHKTEEEAAKDSSFLGMFIVRNGNKIVLMEKIIYIVPGMIWNSHETKIVKLGTFMVVQHDISEIKACGCNQKFLSPINNNGSSIFLNELKERLSRIEDNFGLRKTR